MFERDQTTSMNINNHSDSIVNTIEMTYVSNLETNKHALQIIMTKSREVLFSISMGGKGGCFIIFANATQVLMCKYNR